MDIFITITYFTLFSILLFKWNTFFIEGISKKTLVFLFSIKVISGFVLLAIYTYYYTDRSTADIYKYYDDSKIIFDALKENPIDYVKMMLGLDQNTNIQTNYYDQMKYWNTEHSSAMFSDSRVIIRFNALIRLISFNTIGVHIVFINFLSFIGLLSFYKYLNQYTTNKLFFLYSLFLFPSVLFWGSGLLKEGILLFALGMLVKSIHDLINSRILLGGFLFLLGGFLFSYTKFYLIVCFIPVFIGFITNRYLIRNTWLSYGSGILLTLLTSLTLINAPLKFNPLELIIHKQNEFLSLMNSVANNSTVQMEKFNSITDVFLSIPSAIVNTFIRPFAWECTSIFQYLACLENYLILFILLIAFVFKGKIKHLNLLCFSLFYILTLYLLIGLTIPNFGAMARYKVMAIPFIMLALSQMIDFQKIKKLLR